MSKTKSSCLRMGIYCKLKK